jgi:hypothetical protein
VPPFSGKEFVMARSKTERWRRLEFLDILQKRETLASIACLGEVQARNYG